MTGVVAKALDTKTDLAGLCMGYSGAYERNDDDEYSAELLH